MWETEAPWVAHVPKLYRDFLHDAYNVAGLPVDQLNFLCIIFAAIGFGFVYRFVPGRMLRHLFGSGVGMCFIYLLYGPNGSLVVAAYVMLLYAMIQTRSARAVFWTSLGVLFGICGYFMLTKWMDGTIAVYRLDVTTVIMGLCVRVNSLIYDILDGDLIRAGKELHKKPHIAKYRRAHALESPLSFLEYISFMTFFPTIIAGSSPQIKHYLDLVDGSLFTAHGLQSAPYCWGKMLSSFLQGTLCAGIMLVLSQQMFPVSAVGDADWLQLSLFMRIAMVSWSTYCGKAKYHFSWHFVDLSRFSSGLGFNGVEKKEDKVIAHKWDACENIIWRCEFAQNTGEVVNNWNMSVNTWLKFYVYERFEGVSKTTALFLTRITSAVFHGTYPSYYMFFAISAVWSAWHDSVRAVIPTYKECKDAWYGPIVWFLWYVFTIGGLHSLGYIFVQWDITTTWEVYKSIYFLPIVVMLATWPITMMLPKRRRDKKKKPTPPKDLKTSPKKLRVE